MHEQITRTHKAAGKGGTNGKDRNCFQEAIASTVQFHYYNT